GQNTTMIAQTYTASGLTAGYGKVSAVIGALPASPVAGSGPGIIEYKLSGQIFYGANGISASGTNAIEALGANVVFNTGSLSAAAISLNGGVQISAVGNPPQVTSLDLNNPAAVSNLTLLQSQNQLGGTL